MIIEKKGINGFSTNNNRRLHLKMQARGVKHNRTLSVLRQQRKGRGVTMVSTNNNKKSSWKQVRRSDQLRYPIHNRSFIAHGRLWMPCAPASTIKDKKPRLLSIRTCWLCVFGTDCDTHTHTAEKQNSHKRCKVWTSLFYDVVFAVRTVVFVFMLVFDNCAVRWKRSESPCAAPTWRETNHNTDKKNIHI